MNSPEQTHKQLDSKMEDRILHILSLFPKVSPSMLQISLGSGVPSELWKQALERLIESGHVYRYTVNATGPTGRSSSVTVISSRPDDSPEQSS